MDCSPPGASVHGISQARILKWVAISSPEDLPDPEIEPESPALAGGFFTTELPGKPMPTDVENLARHFTRSEKNLQIVDIKNNIPYQTFSQFGLIKENILN